MSTDIKNRIKEQTHNTIKRKIEESVDAVKESAEAMQRILKRLESGSITHAVAISMIQKELMSPMNKVSMNLQLATEALGDQITVLSAEE